MTHLKKVPGYDRTFDVRHPAELIRFGICSLIWHENQPGTVVDMAKWFSLRYDGTCSACLGGAAIMGQLGVDKAARNQVMGNTARHNLTISVGEELATIAFALDNARRGDITWVFREMGLSIRVGSQFNRKIPAYDQETRGRDFKLAMFRLARDIDDAKVYP